MSAQNFRFEDPWGTAPKRGEDLSWTDMYHHAKFHADRCHRRRDICNRIEKKTATNNTLLYNVWRVINKWYNRNEESTHITHYTYERNN